MLMRLTVFFLAILFVSCKDSVDSNKQMAAILDAIKKKNANPENLYSSDIRMAYYDSLYRSARDPQKILDAQYTLVKICIENGDENIALGHATSILKKIADSTVHHQLKVKVLRQIALAWMRSSEKINHNTESYVFPIEGRGVHRKKIPAEKAINFYEQILKEAPGDISLRWILNITYMAVDGYPSKVPSQYLIAGLNADTVAGVRPFTDAGIKTGLSVYNRAGGTVVEDFNNDGYLDVITSSESLDEYMNYFINNGNGTFSNASEHSGLKLLSGGTNIMQTDYNNDGFMDIFITRRGLRTAKAVEPNSLLKNNGDGTFTDVTIESGLMVRHPTQSATWADFNNDGWLDIYIGNEAGPFENAPCELFINNKNGTFTDIAKIANAQIFAFVKGVTSADYNNDGFIDIFLSAQDGRKILLKNTGLNNGVPIFKNVSVEAGFTNSEATSTTWFWDYDNDGWQDLVLISKKFSESANYYFASEALGMPIQGHNGKLFFYRNRQDGTFEEIARAVNLDKVCIAMGANFGDIDNDGYLDFYLGTGSHDLGSIVPNKLFRNNEGKSFTDITTSARVGNLQKGNGVSFADLDNDGDHDIYIDQGGAYKGDKAQSSLYLNPGQNENRWIKLDLKGVNANKAAIGANIKVYFRDNGKDRMVCREVNSGGSFGSNPLIQHIGLGNATVVDRIVIKWPGNNAVQSFNNLQPGQTYIITEGNNVAEKRSNLKMLDFMDENRKTNGTTPLVIKK